MKDVESVASSDVDFARVILVLGMVEKTRIPETVGFGEGREDAPLRIEKRKAVTGRHPESVLSVDGDGGDIHVGEPILRRVMRAGFTPCIEVNQSTIERSEP
jgi:hypothetical protein